MSEPYKQLKYDIVSKDQKSVTLVFEDDRVVHIHWRKDEDAPLVLVECEHE